MGTMLRGRCVGVLFALALVAPAFAQNQSVEQMLSVLPPRELGPGTMGGRIMDIAVYEKEPRIFYVGGSSGGAWRTDNGGMTFRPVWHQEGSGSVGSIAISQKNPDVIWIGSGEPASRNSTLVGDGVYKSLDGGKTWEHVGLKNSRQIGRVILHPTDENTVWVAALGNLWGPNDERGVYNTTDGGKTWTRTLFVNDTTGAVDLDIDPKNPNVLYASMWERRRWPWDVMTRGAGSGMYKSTDGGKTWKKVTRGLPGGDLGRIGVDVNHSDPKHLVAVVDAVQGGVYQSDDAGESWRRTANLNPRPFYFSEIKQDPSDRNRVYVLGVSLHISTDGGRTFREGNDNVHSDWHSMWIDPSDSNHIIVGTDGGPYQTRDRAQTWELFTQIAMGHFYAVHADMRRPYWVYGGLQDNGGWAGPTQTRRGFVGPENWISLSGGDGFTVLADPNDWTTVYTESQGGAVQRVDQLRGGGRSIRPRGENLRWNWHTPIALSPFNSRTVYVGSQHLHRSMDRGDNWETISPDLTTNDKSKQVVPQGDIQSTAENHTTIVSIAESPRTPGVIWVGTDDGNVQVTQDGGKTWTNTTPNIPEAPPFTYVSSVSPSRFEAGRCFVTLDGHRNNDYETWAFVTDDFGKTWKRVGGDLKDAGAAYVIREGVLNPDYLVLGTENFLYVSLDRGVTWGRYKTGNWPTVRMNDVFLHPRDNDALVATHGRSVWQLPFRVFEYLTEANLAKPLYVAPASDVLYLGRTPRGWFGGDRGWAAPNSQPGTLITYHVNGEGAERANIEILRADGTRVAQLAGPGTKGLQAVPWRPNSAQVPAGDYSVVVTVGEEKAQGSVKIIDLTDTLNHEVGLE